MNRLPEEVLSNIFKFLPLDDRKNVRLTSRLWNYACNHPEIIEREKFVFRYTNGRKDSDRIGHHILKCRNIRPHFQFELLSLNESLVSSVWEHCGAQLKSLSILGCEINEKTLSDIITYCSNITSFFLHHEFVSRQYENLKEVDICSETTLDNLIRRQVKHEKLLSFKIYLENKKYCSREWYRKVLQIYPNIHTFGVHSEMLEGFDPENGLHLPSTVQNFIVDGISREMPFNSSSQLKFKELKIFIHLLKEVNNEINDIRHFLSYQTELEKLDFQIEWFNGDLEVKSLLFIILRTSHKLKVLVLKTWHYFSFNVTEFNEFMNAISRMESVNLSVITDISNDQSQVDDFLVPIVDTETTLEKLKLIGSEDTCLAILNRCPSLKHLNLRCVTVEILRTIFRNHTKLRTLRLKLNLITDPGVFGTYQGKARLDWNQFSGQSPIVQFQDLKELVVKHVEEFDDVNVLLLAFDFPNLKRFCLRWKDNNRRTRELQSKLFLILDTLSNKAPGLEYLKLSFSSFPIDDVSVDNVAHFFNRWNRLQTVVFTNPFERWTENQEGYVKQLFIQCLSLRCVTFTSTCTYYYDRDVKILRGHPHIIRPLPPVSPVPLLKYRIFFK